ncbi:MAG: glycosyltransferase [Candidatus Magasanikiibacteriota bacterium]
MLFQPKISVIMPFYNDEKYLEETVESILVQTFVDFEFIIINDYSKDKSGEIIKKYLSDQRIRYFNNLENKGIVDNTNMAIEKARAEFIAIVDHDDLSDPTRLQKEFDFLTNNPDYALVSSFVKYIDSVGKEIGFSTQSISNEDIRKDIFLHCPFWNPACMFRKSVWQEVGKYRKQYELCQDYDLLFRIVYSGYKVANLPEFLLKYRIHVTNASFKRVRELEKKCYHLRIEMVKKFNLKLSWKEKLFMWAHLILGYSLSGYQKKKIETLFKKIFYGRKI